MTSRKRSKREQVPPGRELTSTERNRLDDILRQYTCGNELKKACARFFGFKVVGNKLTLIELQEMLLLRCVQCARYKTDFDFDRICDQLSEYGTYCHAQRTRKSNEAKERNAAKKAHILKLHADAEQVQTLKRPLYLVDGGQFMWVTDWQVGEKTVITFDVFSHQTRAGQLRFRRQTNVKVERTSQCSEYPWKFSFCLAYQLVHKRVSDAEFLSMIPSDADMKVHSTLDQWMKRNVDVEQALDPFFIPVLSREITQFVWGTEDDRLLYKLLKPLYQQHERRRASSSF